MHENGVSGLRDRVNDRIAELRSVSGLRRGPASPDTLESMLQAIDTFPFDSGALLVVLESMFCLHSEITAANADEVGYLSLTLSLILTVEIGPATGDAFCELIEAGDARGIEVKATDALLIADWLV